MKKSPGMAHLKNKWNYAIPSQEEKKPKFALILTNETIAYHNLRLELKK